MYCIGSIRPHAHLRFAKFSQHFIDVLDLTLSPLDFFLKTWPDMTREDGRRFLGRFGVSGLVQTQVMAQLSDGQKSRCVMLCMIIYTYKQNRSISFSFILIVMAYLIKTSCFCFI